MTTTTISTLPVHVDHLGQTRRLSYVPPSPAKIKLRAGRTNIQTIRQNAGLSPLILPGTPDFKEIDFVTGFPTSLINNQGQEGACTAASCCGAYQRVIYIREGKIIAVSWQFIYDQINNGVDQGSNIIDSMGVMEGMGAPLLSLYPKSLWKPNLIPPGAAMYREDLPITLGNSAECATALLMGMFPQVPILVTSTFERFNPQGIAWNGVAPRQHSSNHSIYLAGIKMVNGAPYFILVNSWDATWGPFQNGTCLIPFAAVDNPATADDGYCHASPVDPTFTLPIAA